MAVSSGSVRDDESAAIVFSGWHALRLCEGRGVLRSTPFAKPQGVPPYAVNPLMVA